MVNHLKINLVFGDEIAKFVNEITPKRLENPLKYVVFYHPNFKCSSNEKYLEADMIMDDKGLENQSEMAYDK